ncbi:MAG: hypothetical protein JNL11_13335 [Bdellovibrionaceae bacterium]|nr:hypothetical protein [Pseudobdellovibrionaceae bacterium]
MQRKSLLMGLMLIVSTGAWAGKEEREKKTELEPRVKAAAEAFKSKCGGGVSITVDWKSYKTVNDMSQIGYAMDAIKDGAAAYCTDDESKKIMSTVKSIDYVFGKTDQGPKFKSGKITASTDSTGYNSWDQMAKLVDQ